MKWLSRKTETIILVPSLFLGLAVSLLYQGNPITLIAGFTAFGASWTRLVELYLFPRLTKWQTGRE